MNRDEKRNRLREEALRRRDNIPPDVRSELSKHIIIRVIDWIEAHSIDAVMLYLSMRSEVETDGLLDYLLTHDKIALAPVMEMKHRTLVPYRVTNPKTDLARHRYGMLQPNRNSCPKFPANEIGLIVVPGVAFDIKGYRIGYGGGFYDRFLLKCPQTSWIGLAFAEQMIEDTLPQAWDVPLHCIFTESGNGCVSREEYDV